MWHPWRRSRRQQAGRSVILAASRGRSRPSVELLEDRLAPATHTWNAPTGPPALWSNSSNWTVGAPQLGEANVVLIFPNNPALALTTFDDLDGLAVDQITL